MTSINSKLSVKVEDAENLTNAHKVDLLTSKKARGGLFGKIKKCLNNSALPKTLMFVGLGLTVLGAGLLHSGVGTPAGALLLGAGLTIGTVGFAIKCYQKHKTNTARPFPMPPPINSISAAVTTEAKKTDETADSNSGNSKNHDPADKQQLQNDKNIKPNNIND